MQDVNVCRPGPSGQPVLRESSLVKLEWQVRAGGPLSHYTVATWVFRAEAQAAGE